MNKLYKVGILIPLLAVIIAPMMGVIVNAEGEGNGEAPDPLPPHLKGGEAPIEDLSEATAVFNKILDWVNTVFWIVAAIFILVAAFQYLTAGGNEDKVKKAKSMLIYAVIAVAIALFATGLDTLIYNVLSGPSS